MPHNSHYGNQLLFVKRTCWYPNWDKSFSVQKMFFFLEQHTVIKMVFFYHSTRIWQVQDTTQTLLSSSGRSSAPFLVYLCKLKFLDEETVYVTHKIDKSLQCFFWPSKTESNTFSLLSCYNRSKALFILWPDDLCAACVFKSYSYLRFSWNVCAQQTAGPMTTMQRFVSTTLIFSNRL